MMAQAACAVWILGILGCVVGATAAIVGVVCGVLRKPVAVEFGLAACACAAMVFVGALSLGTGDDFAVIVLPVGAVGVVAVAFGFSAMRRVGPRSD